MDGCTTDVTQLAKLYLEYEARINYYCTAQPVSLPRIVHAALSELSEKLDLNISPLSPLFTDTMARILAPSPILSYSTLPNSFWGYALQTAVYILNVVPSKSVQRHL